jgi:flavin reductase (DIM6/NTAB) family NADH-FMN oxidoreductase RutF
MEVDNERARWPCFFPSSPGVITTWGKDDRASAMPCGSTTVISRHPMVIAICVSYAPINERYAPRSSLERIRTIKRFGCGVPYIDDEIVGAINYLGNISFDQDPGKIENCGMTLIEEKAARGAISRTPVFKDLPIHFDCRVTGSELLGTHEMFFGEVERILIRDDLDASNPLEWCPWPELATDGD